ncbi:DUF559 domain-containing protein, partial [Escherichia sp. TWPC-MK]
GQGGRFSPHPNPLPRGARGPYCANIVTPATNRLESQGWTVLRFWNNEIDCNEETVLENILQELNRRSPSP